MILTVGALVCKEWNAASRRREAWVTFRFRDGAGGSRGGGGGGGTSSSRSLRTILQTNPTVWAMLRFVEKVDVALPSTPHVERKRISCPTDGYISVLQNVLNLGREEKREDACYRRRHPLRSLSMVLDAPGPSEMTAVQEMINDSWTGLTRLSLHYSKRNHFCKLLWRPSPPTLLRDLRLTSVHILVFQ